MVDKNFFKRHQKILLKIINFKIGGWKLLGFKIREYEIGRWLFAVEKMGHRAKGKEILELKPNAIVTKLELADIYERLARARKNKDRKAIARHQTEELLLRLGAELHEAQLFCRPEYAMKVGKVLFWLPVGNIIEGWNLKPAYKLAILFSIGMAGLHFPIIFCTTDKYNSKCRGGWICREL